MLGLLLGGLARGGAGMAMARRPMGGRTGVLGGLMQRGNRQAPQQQPSDPRPVTPQQAVAEGSQKAEEQASAPVQQAQQQVQKPSADGQPLVTTLPQSLEQSRPQKETPLSGLMEPPPPVADAPPRQSDGRIVPQTVVNTSDAMSPVARPASEKFGSRPTPMPSEMADRITLDAPPRLPRINPAYKEANPSRQPNLSNQKHTADQGYRYQGPTSVLDNMSPLRFTRR